MNPYMNPVQTSRGKGKAQTPQFRGFTIKRQSISLDDIGVFSPFWKKGQVFDLPILPPRVQSRNPQFVLRATSCVFEHTCAH
eukprot:6037433-Amphidinium_carterae.1